MIKTIFVRLINIYHNLIRRNDDKWYHWFSGFVDGEGCFTSSVKYTKEKIEFNKKNGNRQTFGGCSMSFTIGLSAKDTYLLEEIRNKIKVGYIYCYSNNHIRCNGKRRISDVSFYMVTKRQDIISVIIPIFQKYPLKTKKKEDFEKWCKIMKIVESDYYLTNEGKEEIIQIRSTMNRRGDSTIPLTYNKSNIQSDIMIGTSESI